MQRYFPVFLANIFLALHYAAILYVNSTFLAQFFGPSEVSLLFVSAAVFNILLFVLTPWFLMRFGTRILYIFFILHTGSALLGLATATSALQAGGFFIIYAGAQFMIYYCLDIFLENISTEKKTGGIRGLYLTIGSGAIASAPLLLTFLVQGEELMPVYFASALLLVPPLLLAFFLKSPSRQFLNIARVHKIGTLPLAAWWQAQTVRRATLARAVLEIFYALMVIYTPLYLYNNLGFEWSEMGIIFTIMLLPFVIFEWPMGVLADKLYGEKEIMSIGFFITGCTLLVMPFLSATLALWAGVLFLSRVGASFIEVATESHFFKHVDARDSSLISIFRLSRPTGLILGSLIGLISLQLFSFEKIFFVLAIVMFLGLKESLYLEDTL